MDVLVWDKILTTLLIHVFLKHEWSGWKWFLLWQTQRPPVTRCLMYRHVSVKIVSGWQYYYSAVKLISWHNKMTSNQLHICKFVTIESYSSARETRFLNMLFTSFSVFDILPHWKKVCHTKIRLGTLGYNSKALDKGDGFYITND